MRAFEAGTKDVLVRDVLSDRPAWAAEADGMGQLIAALTLAPLQAATAGWARRKQSPGSDLSSPRLQAETLTSAFGRYGDIQSVKLIREKGGEHSSQLNSITLSGAPDWLAGTCQICQGAS